LRRIVLPLPEVIQQVRRTRLRLDLTQADLAREAGTSQSLIAKLERNRLSPSYEAVRRILEALDRLAASDEARAKDVMNRKPTVADPAEPIGKALARMKQHGFSQLPVVDHGQPVGSLSEAAVLAALEEGAALEELKRRPVRAIMGPSFPTVDPTTRRRLLIELLRDQDAVLVVQGGRLAGVVTKPDLW
jgi:predicted transcriptional regulator